MSQPAIKELLYGYRKEFFGRGDEWKHPVRDSIVFVYRSRTLLAEINGMIRQSLWNRRAELKGMTVGPSSHGSTDVYFDGTRFGLTIANMDGVFDYAECMLIKQPNPAADEIYGKTYLKCLEYEESNRRFDDEKELIEELVKLRDFFAGHTLEEIDLKEARFDEERAEARRKAMAELVGPIQPPRKKCSPSRRRHNSSNRRRQRQIV
ncbi:MAG: hypothetical protein Hyperionvirus36_5 [Hyperionvirus sp.]|uniref:Uncharacterized protein n=1 Tax=Hyperionvirus sp. TaxID=2487770 RepID=A0A3G5ABV8_9VIRU|nr:MAG: hypothetical protein Hyperionvirus36_5 [Hyperionvirus sp.]